jgi:hypothetical protein
MAALALLSGAVSVNCSKTSDNNSSNAPDGLLKMALTLPSGLTISQVNYTIHSAQPTNAPADKTGTIPTGNAQAAPGVETSYPASTNDTVTLSAVTSDGEACTGTSVPFAVVAGSQTPIMVTLTCGLLTPDASSGSVRVSGTVVDQTDICPTLDSWSVSPLTTGPTGSITLASAASDGNGMADTLSTVWTVSPNPATNPFTNVSGGNATFNCPGSGNFTLTVTVDDHHMPVNCTAVRTFQVSCGSCGNGAVDPGEDCDDAALFANNTCNPNTCKFIPVVCGNNLIQGTEQCDSAAAFANNTCDPATCQNIPVVCGNGLKQPGEECDATSLPTASCDATCHTISACIVCERNGGDCSGTHVTAGATTPYGCTGLSGNAGSTQTACNSLHLCLAQHPNCSAAGGAAASTDPTACFCGALSAGACAGAGSATLAGDCATQYMAVYGGTSDANRDKVIADFFNRSKSVGMANNLYSCDFTKSCFAQCAQ